MEDQSRTRVLVVANRTAATPRLMEAIGERRRRGPCDFALLIPDVADRKRADWTLDNALPVLSKAAGRPVEGIVGASGDPFASVQATSTHAHDGRDDGRLGVRLRDRHPEAADVSAVDPQSDAGVQAGRERELA